MKNFYRRLKLLRGEMSQVSAAAKLGISQQAWARYELNEVKPGMEIIQQICCRFMVSADWLLGLTNERNGNITTIRDPDLVKRNEELEVEVKRLREESLQQKGRIAGLNQAIELLSRAK